LHRLPGRFGPRPRSSAALPFRQLDQFPPDELQHRLFEMSLRLQGVRSRQSRLAVPQSRALCLSAMEACGPPEAFIDGLEFCHLHALPEGCIHMTLPPAVVENVVALGWAERHPVQNLGMWRTLVMVYGPRDGAELDVVFSLVELSWLFARGVCSKSEVSAPVLV
jgi:hypothetical protein